MGTTYCKDNMAIGEIVADLMPKHHGRLDAIEVSVDVMIATNNRGPAVKLHGRPCIATVKVNSLKDRARGYADATITIDRGAWGRLSEASRVAVIDHELEHLQPVRDKKSGQPKYDDRGRPRLTCKPHDWDLGGFIAIVDRHGDAAVDAMAIRKVLETHLKYRQRFLPWGDDMAGEPLADDAEDAETAA